uniref:Solute carrier family 23 member 2 n=1 Tax=Ciona savignyi TaxID=51511 RepID=H2ZM06_CIOSA
MLQTTFGIRLPIMQGGTFSFLPPTFAILSLPHNKFWQRRIREVQGGIAVASCLQILLGFTGAIGFLLRFIGPLTIAPSVALIGLDLFSAAYDKASSQWGIAITAFVVVVCSQYLKNIKVPTPTFSRRKKCHVSWTPVFKMFPVSLLFNNGACSMTMKQQYQYNPFRFPYPGQWGLPTVTVAGVIGMMAGVVSGFVESIGDYYACARLSGAPNPPTHAINRGILTEGFGCMLAGVIGTSTATTSFSENIGAIGITRVGSRRVLQVAGFFFFVLGMLSKFGSIFVTIPDPVIGGLFCVMFGMIAAVGISNLQYVDLNSSRNLFIIGFSLFMGLTVPEWMKANKGVIQTGVIEIDQIITVFLETAMLVGGLLALFFDNTIPGTESER